MKQIIKEMSNSNFSLAKEKWNDRRSQDSGYTIESILLSDESMNKYIVLYSNNNCETIDKEDLMLNMILSLSMPKLSMGDKCIHVSRNEYTRKYRKNLLPSYEKEEFIKEKIIFKKYIFQGVRVFSNVIYITQQYLREDKLFCVLLPSQWNLSGNDLCPFNKERLLELCNTEDLLEEKEETFLNSVFEKVSKLAFVKKVEFNPQKISICIKPYVLWFNSVDGKPVGLNMPGCWIDFHLKYKKYQARMRDRKHPHISSTGDICLGNFQEVINKNWYDIEFSIINIYELLTTYNRSSVYFNILFQNESGRYECYENMIEKTDEELKEGFEPGINFCGQTMSIEEFKEKYPDRYALCI